MAINAPPLPGFFMQFNNPDHSRLRDAVSREFLIGRMEALRPRIRGVLDELIDAMVGKARSADRVQELALPMVARVACEFPPGAVDELLRFLTVNHAGLPRAALDDVEIAGQLIRAGDGVLVMINAANRDAAIFSDPETFDIHREAKRHLAFGYGLHKCLGLGLARVEMETVFFGLFKRLPDLRLISPIQFLSFRHDMATYGLNELPVAW